jgi:hypothetical protein
MPFRPYFLAVFDRGRIIGRAPTLPFRNIGPYAAPARQHRQANAGTIFPVKTSKAAQP